MRGFGANLILTPGNEGMKGAINKAKVEIAEIIPNVTPNVFNIFDMILNYLIIMRYSNPVPAPHNDEEQSRVRALELPLLETER